MAITNIPDPSTLSDGQYIEVQGPDGIVTGYYYDKQTQSLYAKDSQVIYPNSHGRTHISSDPIPNATCDNPGLMSATDKCKLESLTQTRLGVLGFVGSGFPDDGGWLTKDIILASNSDFISIEKFGNVIRFSAETPIPLGCNCTECVQLFWMQDPTDVSAITPPVCNGKLPGVNGYGELKIYLMPQSLNVSAANPSTQINQKGNYPSFIFKRYDNGLQPSLGQLDIVLKRNAVNKSTADVGHSMTPGGSGDVECVWFVGLNNDGQLMRFDLDANKSEPGLLGQLLFNGHTITKQMAVIVNYTPTITSTNQYTVKMWDVLNAKPIGDSFTATNTWRYQNPESTTTGVDGKMLTLDITSDILPIGTLVDIWQFKIGESNNTPILRSFFNCRPTLNPNNLWSMVGGIQFGDLLQARREEPSDGSEGYLVHDIIPHDDFENSMWGVTGIDTPLLLAGDITNQGTVGAPILNIQHRATIDNSIPGLTILNDSGTDPFIQRPVMLWNRTSIANSCLLKADIGRPTGSEFSPYDILLAAPISSNRDTYMRVAEIGVIDGVNFIRVVGVNYQDIPQTGTVRCISFGGDGHNEIFTYNHKLIFPSQDQWSVVLMASARHNHVYRGSVGSVVELLPSDYTAPCVRVEFSISGGLSVVQFKVGTLDMSSPYENKNPDLPIDNYVRGMKPGYAISAAYAQAADWDGSGTQPATTVPGFSVVTGGVAADGNEYWNTLEIMHREDQVWIWWNGLIVPPSPSMSLSLATPVTIDTPYFPVTKVREYGKYGMRLWPSATVRRIELRTQLRSYSEFSRGQLELS